MIRVYAWDGVHKAEFLGIDTIENFNEVRDLTRACGGTLTRDAFSIVGHEDHVFWAYVIND